MASTTTAAHSSTSLKVTSGVGHPMTQALAMMKTMVKEHSSTPPAPQDDDHTFLQVLYVVGPAAIVVALLVISLLTVKLKAEKRAMEDRLAAARIPSISITIDTTAVAPPCYDDVMKNLAIYKKPAKGKDPSLPTYAEAKVILANQQRQARSETNDTVQMASHDCVDSTNQDEPST